MVRCGSASMVECAKDCLFDTRCALAFPFLQSQDALAMLSVRCLACNQQVRCSSSACTRCWASSSKEGSSSFFVQPSFHNTTQHNTTQTQQPTPVNCI